MSHDTRDAQRQVIDLASGLDDSVVSAALALPTKLGLDTGPSLGVAAMFITTAAALTQRPVLGLPELFAHGGVAHQVLERVRELAQREGVLKPDDMQAVFEAQVFLAGASAGSKPDPSPTFVRDYGVQ